jgi:cob(I)alamin adenosyltransferase
MPLYTRFGDKGETALFDGTRVWKDDLRVSAYGDVDELNAVLGWCRVAATGELAEHILAVQHDLFAMGAQLAVLPGCPRAPGLPRVGPEDCRRLEGWIDEAAGRVPPLSRFVLPGGNELSARLQIARTTCRRTERAVISLHRVDPVSPDVIIYLNRLSDLLFAWSRLANHEAGCPEVQWIPAPRGGPA